MEALVTQIQGLSGSPEDLAQLNQQLKGQVASLASQPAVVQPAFLALDPIQHSLGQLYLL